jgi:hypothetical protein
MREKDLGEPELEEEIRSFKIIVKRPREASEKRSRT